MYLASNDTRIQKSKYGIESTIPNYREFQSLRPKLHRRLKLAITQLRDANGQWRPDPGEIAEIFVHYYKQLLGEKTTTRLKANETVLKNGTVLDTENDVKQSMIKIDQTKSPRPDGYGSGFYKEAGGIVERDITEAVLEFFHNGKLLRQVNATNIALISKVDSPEWAS
ncbi:hypothetical protein KY284_031019 [Solanum tuberosum]|nr:hypothetical protein KY284_031019 [Solanum tuberosum]